MINEEKTKWYNPDTLDVVTECQGKTKMVKPTVVHARKAGYLPSVTSVIAMLGSHSLERWKIEQRIRMCALIPFSGEFNESNLLAYMRMIDAKADEYRIETADRGKELHAAVDEWITNQKAAQDPAAQLIIEELKGFFKANNVDVAITERPFGGKEFGFVGTPDILAITTDGKNIILDLKSTNLAAFKAPYESWRIQLGAYRGLTKSIEGTRLVQIVADRNTGQTIFIDHEDPDIWYDCFLHLFNAWTIIHDYDPRKQV